MLEAIRQFTNSWGEAWDVEKGPEFDVLVTENLERLLRMLKTGWFWWVHVAPPCATFSRARQPPLRSFDHVWGLPDRNPKDQAKIDEGNALALIAVEVIKICIRLGIGFTLENPRSSMIWEFPAMADVLSLEEVYRVEVDYCMYGEEWMKPTTFITNVRRMTKLESKCRGSFSRCSRTGQAHRELRGRSPCGLRWTQLACAYPLELCEKYATALQEVEPHWESIPQGARSRLHGDRERIVRATGPAMPLLGHWLEKKWRLLFQGQWSNLEHNNVLELRTVVAVLRHLSRTSQSWGHRVLFFADSLVSLGVLRKGRSSAKDLLHLARVGGIIQMVCRIRGYFRWVPSEINLADGPSRGLGIGAADDTVAVHVGRGVPRDLLRRLQERDRQARRGASHL